jgi:protein TonB
MPEGAADGTGEPALTYRKPTPIDVREPVYPPQCLRLGIEGTVRVKVLVGVNGRPQDVSVDRSSCEPLLDQPRWRRPASGGSSLRAATAWPSRPGSPRPSISR